MDSTPTKHNDDFIQQANVRKKPIGKYPGPLWISWVMALFGAGMTGGYNNSVFNLPEDYMVCWIEGIQTGNETLINKTDPLCATARDFSSELSNQALNFYALTVASSLIGCLSLF